MSAVNEITTDRLRELASARSAPGKVLSIYVNLDPTEFATAPARATEIRSVLDEAERCLRDETDLTHQERTHLEADLGRARDHLLNGLDASGARGLALFCSEPADLFEVVKLPQPVSNHVTIGNAPHVEPLARIGTREALWVVLVDRRRARLLTGSPDGIVEVWSTDSGTHGQHDQGGWSQARYQRSVDKEASDHLKAVAEELATRLRQERVDWLLLGGTPETVGILESHLHPDVARCVAGKIETDVGNASAGDVLRACEPLVAELRATRDRELIERFEEARGTNGRGIAGLSDVLPALHERRVETLLLTPGFHAKGVRCPRCGWLGVTASSQCPADGAATELVDDVIDAAVEATFTQDGRVRVLDVPQVRDAGGIAAILRF